jgi:putative transposase
MQKQHIKLLDSDRLELEGLQSKSSLTVKIHRRVSVLLLLDKGKSYTEVRKEIGITYPSIREICDKYEQRGSSMTALDYLSDKPRAGRPPIISGTERAKITALACSDAPQGHAKWTLRLLADRVVELGICDELSHTYVGEILKKTSYNPTVSVHGA